MLSPSLQHFERDSGNWGGWVAAISSLILAGQYPEMLGRCSGSPRSSSRCDPTFFLGIPRPLPPLCSRRHALFLLFLHSSPIQSAAVLSRVFRNRVATSLASSLWSRRWRASG